jgi:hypothetical protein
VRAERTASALRRVAARQPRNKVPPWSKSEPLRDGGEPGVAAADEALILTFLKDASAAS